MLCQNCHENEATIHVQQIVDGKVRSIHLCAKCAAEKGIETPDLDDFNLAEVLFDIAGKVAKASHAASPGAKKKEEAPESRETEVVCPHCGWTLQQFRKTGYLGCPSCYQIFAPLIDGMLKNIHRGDRHAGKIPLSAGAAQREGHETALMKRELEMLRKEQEEKIRAEDYEAAAVLRDKIRTLTASLKKKGGAKS
ncbi:MAG: hypothetical protein IJS14_10875 [Lentisphaeria bacterium]|nr:hypothetical protein [Lentisphaeria bacterium]